MCKKISLFVLVLIFVGFVGCANFGIAFAEETTTYSNVLNDLQKDESFNADDYPVDASDSSLQVIQIAESMDKELFLYVYQPSEKYVATHIHLAQVKQPTTADTHEYKLTLLNSSGTLFKYKVEEITLLDDLVRYYDISSIFRAWNEWSDGTSDNENIVSYKSFDVGQLWIAEYTGEELVYSMTTIETIEILNPFVNHISYSKGQYWWSSQYDSIYSHYIAFSTDKQMDDLLSASVYFDSRDVTMHGGVYTYSKSVAHELVIEKSQEVSSLTDSSLLYANDYNYSRIVKAENFLSNENSKLSDDAKSNIVGSTWVLRFWETELMVSSNVASVSIYSTEVTNVTILRLEFETDGVSYNLGAVMNKYTDSSQYPFDDDDSNAQNWLDSAKKWFGSVEDWWNSFTDVIKDIVAWFEKVFAFISAHWQVFALIIGLIVIGILCAVCKPVLIAVKYLLIALWYVVTAPLQIIVFIIRKIKGSKKQ